MASQDVVARGRGNYAYPICVHILKVQPINKRLFQVVLVPSNVAE